MLKVKYIFFPPFSKEGTANSIQFHESEQAEARAVAYALAQLKDKFQLVSLQDEHNSFLYEPLVET